MASQMVLMLLGTSTVILQKEVAMCTYHGITMDSDATMYYYAKL